MIVTDERGLYSEGWQGAIVEEAFAHPAKFSRRLIRWIYDHLAEERLVKPGDRVLDPFAGVALGALDAMRIGLHWTGVELEPEFVSLGQQNIELWCGQFDRVLPGWGTARLLQGDSRHLDQVLRTTAQAVVSSLPYSDGCRHTGGPDRSGYMQGGEYHGLGYDVVVGSPPWERGAEGALRKEKFKDPKAFAEEMSSRDGSGTRSGTTPVSRLAQMERDAGKVYGDSPGQLGAMSSGDFQAMIGSPPYEDSVHSKGHGIDWSKADSASRGNRRRGEGCKHEETLQAQLAYSDNPDNMGSGSGDTFWSAARLVVEQVYDLLAPGGVAVWVVKDFVRDKKRVDFTGQWAQMCESMGFVLLHHHRAWLVEDRGSQRDLWGQVHTNTVERKSFFRRLAEKNGSPRIDWESVLCMRKL